MATANYDLADDNYFLVTSKSTSALDFYETHPSKVSEASLKAATPAATS
jgi:hypothetical protein